MEREPKQSLAPRAETETIDPASRYSSAGQGQALLLRVGAQERNRAHVARTAPKRVRHLGFLAVPSLQSLFDSIDELRVGALAQTPFCADVRDGRKPAEVYTEAVGRGFDNLPVRDADGVIRRVVATSALKSATTWREVGRLATTLSADTLVARDAPAFSLLDRFAEPGFEILLCLGREGVDGVVTIFDLNAPAAHLLGFGLALIVEAEIAAVLRAELGEDPDEALRYVKRVLPKASGIARWKDARAQGRDLDLASALTFYEKTKVLEGHGGSALAVRCGCSKRALLRELMAIRKLRNAVAHYDEKYRLADPWWVHNRMRRTLSLAKQLRAVDSDLFNGPHAT